MRHLARFVLLSTGLCSAQITNVAVEPNSTAAVLSFNAPASTNCIVDVTRTFTGDSPDFSKPVEPMDDSKFPGVTTAAGGVSSRRMLIGGTGVKRSPVNNWIYSLALEQFFQHAFR